MISMPFHRQTLVGLAALAAPLAAFAGEPAVAKEPKAPKAKASKKSNNGDWCEWLLNDPGLLYSNLENPYIQSFKVGGRLHFQAARVDGTDVNGRDFVDDYTDFRRLRLETKTKFLQYLTAEVNVNLVDDTRFRDQIDQELEFGYDRFDELSLQFDLGKAVGSGPFDAVKLKYGRMKLKMGVESHQSSNEILTVERSLLSDRIGGDLSRPTGFTVELDKGDFELVLGVFSAEDDSDSLADWGEGEFYYGSFVWKPDKDFKMMLDHAWNDRSDLFDDALGYASATTLSAEYDKRWGGLMAAVVYGDNGGRPIAFARRDDFGGFMVMPWFWLIHDRLQLVTQYQFAESDAPEGLQLGPRYIRGDHGIPGIDDENGRGDRHESLYLGLNYHFCPDVMKIMTGVSYDRLATSQGMLEAFTYQIAFRASF